MEFLFSDRVFQWRGPAPFYFVAVPEDESTVIKDNEAMLTYGWGVIPVQVRVGGTSWETSLFPREGRYVVPLKVAVRRAEGIADGDLVEVRLRVEPHG